ncbi:MAG: (d)CMP kinase [Hyphomonadaceae bacterium]|nr:(d)CMP kinase [Hyphomonadaceae bacterium]
MIVAIDGTAASGKGTLARRISARYGLAHLDTGLLYRAVGCLGVRNHVPLEDEDALAGLAEQMSLAEFDEAELRSDEAGANASIVAAHPKVRAALIAFQRRFVGHAGGAVLDGRDIGTVICPDADVKLWVDADVEERARRRHKELEMAGGHDSYETVLAKMRARDARDAGRTDAPMVKAADAHLIDTTEMTIEAAVERACEIIDRAVAQRNSSRS